MNHVTKNAASKDPPEMSKYPAIRYLSKASITIPNMETLNTPQLGTVDP